MTDAAGVIDVLGLMEGVMEIVEDWEGVVDNDGVIDQVSLAVHVTELDDVMDAVPVAVADAD